jgi:hypothetical protein
MRYDQTNDLKFLLEGKHMPIEMPNEIIASAEFKNIDRSQAIAYLKTTSPGTYVIYPSTSSHRMDKESSLITFAIKLNDRILHSPINTIINATGTFTYNGKESIDESIKDLQIALISPNNDVTKPQQPLAVGLLTMPEYITKIPEYCHIDGQSIDRPTIINLIKQKRPADYLLYKSLQPTNTLSAIDLTVCLKGNDQKVHRYAIRIRKNEFGYTYNHKDSLHQAMIDLHRFLVQQGVLNEQKQLQPYVNWQQDLERQNCETDSNSALSFYTKKRKIAEASSVVQESSIKKPSV